LSIRENSSDLAQTFTLSKVSSYSHLDSEEAVEDPPNADAMMATGLAAPVLAHRPSKLHGLWHHTDSRDGWKRINVGRELAGKGFEHLLSLNTAGTKAGYTLVLGVEEKTGASERVENPANFPKLPAEVFSQSISCLSGTRRCILGSCADVSL